MRTPSSPAGSSQRKSGSRVETEPFESGKTGRGIRSWHPPLAISKPGAQDHPQAPAEQVVAEPRGPLGQGMHEAPQEFGDPSSAHVSPHR